jgi:cyclophilin family peptidyl-prolyl cis-trans isomerase
VQTGDPTNKGTGGQSIWGVPFEDELQEDVKVGLNNHFQYQMYIFTIV